MEVCIISKFPPIQGGIASKTYWLARGCAEAGVKIHVVTNASAVEDEYKISSCGTDYHLPQGVYIHNVEKEIPWHIPFSQLYQEKLLDKALEICNRYKIDLIDSHYLIPYGITAFLASKITGIPYVIRHGGSDLVKFWQRDSLRELLRTTLKHASMIITDKEEFRKLNQNIINIPRYIPDERYFFPKIKDKNDITFAYVGKINHYWHHKSLKEILDLWNALPRNTRLLFLAQGKGKDDFLFQCNPVEVNFLDFIPPWDMPSFLQKIDYLFYLVGNHPIPDFSNIVCEAVACGVNIITDASDHFKCYKSYFDVSKYVIDMDTFQLSKPKFHAKQPFNKSYFSYIQENVNLYLKIKHSE